MSEKKPTKAPYAALRHARIQRGWTLLKAASTLGMRESTLSRYERGHFSRIPLATAERFADVYKIPLTHWRETQ